MHPLALPRTHTTGLTPARIAAAALVTALAVTGCGTPPPTPESSPTPGASASATASAAPETPAEDNLAAPTFAPEGDEFSLDQAAEFPDGLRVEVASITKSTANEQQHGAEGTSGTMVVVEIGLTNNTGSSYPTDPLKVFGFYHGVGAPKIRDTSGALGDSFSGTLGNGESAVAKMAFAIPADQLDQVTVMVDTGKGDQNPVQFTGKVS